MKIGNFSKKISGKCFLCKKKLMKQINEKYKKNLIVKTGLQTQQSQYDKICQEKFLTRKIHIIKITSTK